jgi:hypothetical protein
MKYMGVVQMKPVRKFGLKMMTKLQEQEQQR